MLDGWEVRLYTIISSLHENIVIYILGCKWVFLHQLYPKIREVIPNQSTGSNWNELV